MGEVKGEVRLVWTFLFIFSLGRVFIMGDVRVLCGLGFIEGVVIVVGGMVERLEVFGIRGYV